jgi:ABC-type multidrug transport system fused ATPase/permease subunit
VVVGGENVHGGGEAEVDDDDDVGLTLSDLYAVPRNMRSENLHRTFDVAYNDRRNRRRGGRRLMHALWTVASPALVPAGLCELVVVTCGTAMPLLIRGLIGIVEDNPHVPIMRSGLPYAISIFATSALNGLANHRHRHLSTRAGMSMRSAIVNAIYVRSIYLSPVGRAGLTSGEVSNLMAVDAQKLYEVAQEGHLIWALPLSIALVGYFLVDIIGPSALSGIAVLVGFVPIIERVTAAMMRIRSRRVKYADERVELVSSMLRGMRVTKLNNREDGYLRRVSEVRDNELSCLSREMAVWATTLLMMVTSPILATAACFTTYVLVDGSSNILTTSDAFGVLLLFLALRFPINFAGRLMGKVAQASSAARRISAFLDRPTREDDENGRTGDGNGVAVATTDVVAATGNGAVNDDDDDGGGNEDMPLRLDGAAFRVGGVACGREDEEDDDTDGVETSPAGFKVSKFDFSLSVGEVLAVCGPVGSGKSTLLNGILGEARSVGPGRGVVINGSVAYVPQTPFVLNMSLRDNILFGRQFDQEWYDRVLDACCLRPDLEHLGDAGDSTEIGERGVTLSGGQKQRVSLARAAYARSDLVVLDDPFSALDAGTGEEVFGRLIGSPNGLLRDAAVLLVTHASHLLTNRAVGRILLIVDGKNRFVGTWDDLAGFAPDDERTRRAVDHIRSSVREDEKKDDDDGGGVERGKDWREDDDGKAVEKGRLIQAETREHGLSSLRTWLLWFKRAGGLPFFLTQLLLMAVDRLAYVAIDFFLAVWTSGAEKSAKFAWIEFPPQSDAQGRYLGVYWILILVSALATFLRSEWGVVGGGRATRYVFNNMLASVLRAPMSYFERIPMGRIMNRFTYDTDVNDVNLTQVRGGGWGRVLGTLALCSIAEILMCARSYPYTGNVHAHDQLQLVCGWCYHSMHHITLVFFRDSPCIGHV